MFEKFNIKKGDIITITGAGGKTSLIFCLAQFLSKKGKVLVTTTTKIYVPSKKQFEKMYIGKEEILGENKNIFVIGKDKKDKKLIGLEYQEIENLKDKYDYILIEGDGAKQKILKEWNESEPCIPDFSNKVIGVVNLKILNTELTEENIHRFELFSKKYSDYVGKKGDIKFLIEYIKKGKFFDKNKNEKYIFINEVSQENKNIVKILEKKFGKYFKIIANIGKI